LIPFLGAWVVQVAAIVQAGAPPANGGGVVTVTASSPGLQPGAVMLSVADVE
jgi:hypothetical protein